MINIENKKAISEVNAILKQLDKESLNRIPQEILKKLEENATVSVEYVKPDIPLEDLNLEKETREILAVLSYNYFCNEEERKDWNSELYKNEQIYQKELSSKYSTEDLFKKRKHTELKMIEYKESFFKRVINKIRNILKK